LARYDVFFERGCDCGWAEYSLNEDGSVKVENHCERLPSTTVTTARGRAVVSYPNASPIEGKLNVTIGPAPNMGSNYWILDTDYNHYSIVYHCTQIGSKSVEVAWVLSHDSALDDSVKQKVDNYIDTYFERDQFRWSQQDSKV
jgi:apolipoprotein D and lipocalin family protein